MLRHEFQPGRLIAGLALTATGVLYAGDAGGSWDAQWFTVLPLVTGGLLLAGVTAAMTRGIRKRRRGHRETWEEAGTGSPHERTAPGSEQPNPH